MRPNRTLPPAFPLALLAALLSGCLDDAGEAGTWYELGPELPEGVSASPDGSIVIEKGFAAPEGFTGVVLDEEDWEALARLWDYKC